VGDDYLKGKKMDSYVQEKIMFARRNEIAAEIKHNVLVARAKQIKSENEAEETARTGLRQQLGDAIIRFGFKVAGHQLTN